MNLKFWGSLIQARMPPVVPSFPFWGGLGSLINPFKQKRAPLLLGMPSWSGVLPSGSLAAESFLGLGLGCVVQGLGFRV